MHFKSAFLAINSQFLPHVDQKSCVLALFLQNLANYRFTGPQRPLQGEQGDHLG